MMNRDVSILIVDDFEAWRVQVGKILRVCPEWKIVSDASDGAEAVQKAIERQPDIILLDVGLPTLNGIEAAKTIRQKCPESRIVFVTQNRDSEIKRAALEIGDGFVLKMDAYRELVKTIDTALNNGAATRSNRCPLRLRRQL